MSYLLETATDSLLFSIDIVRNTILSECAVPDCRYVPVGAADEYADSDDVTCVPRCRGDVTVRADDKRFGSAWQIVWSSLSIASSLVTVVTFVVDSTRFRYPERPVVFVAVCRCVPLLTRPET